MCDLTQSQKNRVAKVVEEFIQRGQPFTGYQISQVVELKNIDFSETSRAVREFFNGGKSMFEGWASTQVRLGIGPVMYFKIPQKSVAFVKANQIRKVINAQEVKAEVEQNIVDDFADSEASI